jgi:hypothetical protein
VFLEEVAKGHGELGLWILQLSHDEDEGETTEHDGTVEDFGQRRRRPHDAN